ncbi:hypothetical protein B0H14DRAFT_2567564 [Mycena olivaceomarginata]|nr:hypothetical protein B0H14DRAFT_2567564 [Mycena olivaceomarginata]
MFLLILVFPMFPLGTYQQLANREIGYSIIALRRCDPEEMRSVASAAPPMLQSTLVLTYSLLVVSTKGSHGISIQFPDALRCRIFPIPLTEPHEPHYVGITLDGPNSPANILIEVVAMVRQVQSQVKFKFNCVGVPKVGDIENTVLNILNSTPARSRPPSTF